jgi:hypothetical protein
MQDSPFCPNVDWLKNRAVTLGCRSSTLCCPGSLVIRLSMAAFMNRLGSALTPAVLYHENTGAALDLDNPPPTVCTTSLPAALYPRAAQAVGVMSAQLAAAATMGLRVVQSTDNGATWSPLNTLASSVGGSDRWVNATIWKGDIALAAGTSYRFGVRADRAAGTGTADVGAWRCQLKVVVTSNNGTSSPF